MNKAKKKECRTRIPRELAERIYRLHCEDGVSVRQLSEDFHKPYKTIEGLITRENKRRKGAGLDPEKKLGRPPQIGDELARLKMENELLRDFLHAIGKR
jgi:transposase